MVLCGWSESGLAEVDPCLEGCQSFWGFFEIICKRWRVLLARTDVYGWGRRGDFEYLFLIGSGIFLGVLGFL